MSSVDTFGFNLCFAGIDHGQFIPFNFLIQRIILLPDKISHICQVKAIFSVTCSPGVAGSSVLSDTGGEDDVPDLRR